MRWSARAKGGEGKKRRSKKKKKKRGRSLYFFLAGGGFLEGKKKKGRVRRAKIREGSVMKKIEKKRNSQQEGRSSLHLTKKEERN